MRAERNGLHVSLEKGEEMKHAADRITKYGKRSGILILCLSSALFLFVPSLPAQEDMLKLIETKRLEQQGKEEALKREEQRLNVLRKEVDEKIAAYTKLLAQVEASLKKVEQVKGEKLENVVKAYESMPAEDAAVRLSVLDNPTALLIMTRMKSKKVGAIIALMAPQKAAALTKSMTTNPIKGQ